MALSKRITDLFSLEGKVALVTGSGRGLGWAIAELLAEAGATAIINDLDSEVVAARVSELNGRGLKAEGATFSVARKDEAAAAVDAIVATHGLIDIVVNNAGIQNRKPFVDYSAVEWDAIQQTHVGGTFNVSQAAVRHMIAAGKGGRIVNLGSIATKNTRVPLAAYATAKGALTSLTHALASELGHYGITCNALAPGFMATEFTKTLVENEEFSRFVENRVPLGRWGTPNDIAPAVLYLVSAAGAYVNGAILTIDGGTQSGL
jgi:gluconate 5-dehydrogenase